MVTARSDNEGSTAPLQAKALIPAHGEHHTAAGLLKRIVEWADKGKIHQFFFFWRVVLENNNNIY
jgi:hypothetical protein